MRSHAATPAALLLVLVLGIPVDPARAGKPKPEVDEIEEQTVTKEFVVVGKFAAYRDARSTAEHVAKATTIKLDLRGLRFADGHLTFPKSECEEHGGGYPCYAPRGRADDAAFISIEEADRGPGFEVVAATGSKGDRYLRSTLQRVRKVIATATIGPRRVYQGCMQ